MDRTRAGGEPGLPYSSHPLYKLRIATLFIAVIGFVFDCLAIFSLINGDDERIPIFVFSIALLFISFVFVLHDLVNYAANQARILSAQTRDIEDRELVHSREEPKWPSKRLLVIDVILAILFQWLFWGAFFAIISSYRRYYYSGSETLEAYGNLANFALSITHAIAFWKELIARKKAAWSRDLESRPCQNCGHVDPQDNQESTSPSAIPLPDAEAGPSRASMLGGFRKGKIILPRWARGPNAGEDKNARAGNVEEGDEGVKADEPLLATPAESSTELGYGTLEETVESVGSVPETIVKKKDKGKKRLVEVN